MLPSINLSGKKAIIVTSTNAELYVTGNVSLSGQSYIYIAPGASLKLYVGGASTTLSGQGIANSTGQAKNFFYYGLPTNKTFNLSGNAAFIGVIYAPSAVFNMSGGGTDPTDFVGASITGTVSMSGHYKFHYDESLATYGPSKGYVVTSWNEMTPQEIGSTVVTLVPPL